MNKQDWVEGINDNPYDVKSNKKRIALRCSALCIVSDCLNPASSETPYGGYCKEHHNEHHGYALLQETGREAAHV